MRLNLIRICHLKHTDYDLFRYDRTAASDGIMIYVKKCFKIIEQVASTYFELIYFKININGISYKFISAYKPPDVGDTDFIEHLILIHLCIHII